MTPYRTVARRPPSEPDADVLRFAASVRRGQRVQRAVALTVLALACVGAVVPVARPVRRTPARGVSTTGTRGGRGPLLVHASVLWPAMCGPDQARSPETLFALAVSGLDECPWF